jgi:hypothetical protein
VFTAGEIRQWALHFALLVRRRGRRFVLSERYEPKRCVGSFRSWCEVERAIERYGDEELVGNPQARRGGRTLS